MSQMYGKKLFTGLEYVKGFFILDIAPVYEIEHPFRFCKRALFIRIHKDKAVVIGWWRKSKSVEKTLLLSLRGKILDLEEEQERFRLGQQPGILVGQEEIEKNINEAASGTNGSVWH